MPSNYKIFPCKSKLFFIDFLLSNRRYDKVTEKEMCRTFSPKKQSASFYHNLMESLFTKIRLLLQKKTEPELTEHTLLSEVLGSPKESIKDTNDDIDSLFISAIRK